MPPCRWYTVEILRRSFASPWARFLFVKIVMSLVVPGQFVVFELPVVSNTPSRGTAPDTLLHKAGHLEICLANR